MYRKEKNEKDVLYVLEHLREEDRLEAITIRGENYIETCLADIMKMNDDDILLGCKKSDDTPVCIGGCVPTEDKMIGVVWLLSTPDITNHQICLLRHIKQQMEIYDQKYWITYNFIFNKNALAKKWLTKFGYKFDIQKLNGIKIPENFEFFYRKRETRGLGVNSVG